MRLDIFRFAQAFVWWWYHTAEGDQTLPKLTDQSRGQGSFQPQPPDQTGHTLSDTWSPYLSSWSLNKFQDTNFPLYKYFFFFEDQNKNKIVYNFFLNFLQKIFALYIIGIHKNLLWLCFVNGIGERKSFYSFYQISWNGILIKNTTPWLSEWNGLEARHTALSRHQCGHFLIFLVFSRIHTLLFSINPIHRVWVELFLCKFRYFQELLAMAPNIL